MVDLKGDRANTKTIDESKAEDKDEREVVEPREAAIFLQKKNNSFQFHNSHCACTHHCIKAAAAYWVIMSMTGGTLMRIEEGYRGQGES